MRRCSRRTPQSKKLSAPYTAISLISVLESYNSILDPPFAPWSLLSTRTSAMFPSTSIFTVLRLIGQPMQQILKRVKERDCSKRRLDKVRKHTLSVHQLLQTYLAGLSLVFGRYIAYPLLKLRRHSVQMQNNVQRWLSPSNVQDDLHRHQLEYMPGSCDWILEAPQARDCLTSKHSTTVRILGRPGTGKTVLASFLVNYLAEQNEKNVLYFFCKAGDTEKREPTHILRTLLSQLLLIDKVLYHHVERLYTKSGRATADSYVDVYAALLLALSKTTRTIYTLIDAVDESQDPENFLQALFEAQRVAGGRLIMLFTSRQMHLPFSFDEDLIFDSKTAN